MLVIFSQIAQHLSQEDKRELFCLVDGALKLVHPDDVSKYKSHVQKHLEHGKLIKFRAPDNRGYCG